MVLNALVVVSLCIPLVIGSTDRSRSEPQRRCVAGAADWPLTVTMTPRSQALAVLGVLVVFALGCAEAVSEFAHAGEVQLLLALHRQADPTLNTAMIAATDSGSSIVVGALAAAVALVLLAARRSFEAGVFALRVAGSVLQLPVKFAIDRPRPHLWPRLTHVTSPSFPSGHATQTALLAAAVVALAWRTRYRMLALTVGSVYVGIVGCSRLYLGVHYPSDVVGAWALAALWLAACTLLLKPRIRSSIGFRLRRFRLGGW